MSCSQIETEFNAPKWLDEMFLQKCLQYAINDRQIDVIDFSVVPATKKGDNYASNLYRISIIFTESVVENGERCVSFSMRINTK